MTTNEYIFIDRTEEQRRLAAQAGLFAPLTERLLHAAGLESGMRVLDLGSGAGHVAQLAAGLVGPEGAVTGVERDPAAVESANERLAAEGVANVRIVAGDVQTLEGIEGEFDAVIGRLILMYLPDPAAALRNAAARLRPGGLVAVQEGDMAYDWAVPQTELWDRARRWFNETMEKAGVEPRMGLRLYQTFVSAGLPAPQLIHEATMTGGPDAPAFGWTNVTRGVLPLMERLGVATAAEVDIETLEERLFADVAAADGVVIGPPLTGAWARVG